MVREDIWPSYEVVLFDLESLVCQYSVSEISPNRLNPTINNFKILKILSSEPIYPT